MSEIVLEARDIKRDYHVGGGLFGKPKVVHAVKGVSFKVEKARRWRLSVNRAAASPRWLVFSP